MFVVLNFGFVGIIFLIVSLLGHVFGWIEAPVKGPWLVPAALATIFIGVGFLSIIGRRLRSMSAPFSDLVNAAERVTGKDFTARVDEKGPREVRSLARAFNSMAASLETRDRERRKLFSDVSHELRTPLTVIQGNVEGMLDGLYPRDETHLNAILEQSRVLSRLVDDLRTLAQAESGSLALRKEPTDLVVLVSDVAAGFQSQAQEAGVEIKVAPVSEMPLIDLDPVRLREVLANLIANALRYSPSGGEVMIELGRTNQKKESAQIVTVSDRGKGIPAEDLPHVFDRFYKTRDSSGLGLGLSIARNLVEAHGGSITVANRPGGGAVFQISLLEEMV